VFRMVARARERGIFPRTTGSSARISVFRGPTVRLAKLVGTERGGAGSVAVRLRGWAAAPGRPPADRPHVFGRVVLLSSLLGLGERNGGLPKPPRSTPLQATGP
jgi:hypothetical protein